MQYNGGKIPPDSRFDNNKNIFKSIIEGFSSEEGQKQLAQVEALTELAEKGTSCLLSFKRPQCLSNVFDAPELNCKVAHLALAWIAKKPNTSTVILGASRPEQVVDNLKALEIISKITPEIEAKIAQILDNEPTTEVRLRLRILNA